MKLLLRWRHVKAGSIAGLQIQKKILKFVRKQDWLERTQIALEDAFNFDGSSNIMKKFNLIFA